MRLTVKEQLEKVHKMSFFSRLKFKFYYNMYTILNDAAKKCYDAYWGILNKENV